MLSLPAENIVRKLIVPYVSAQSTLRTIVFGSMVLENSNHGLDSFCGAGEHQR